jgi:hypothetical protein
MNTTAQTSNVTETVEPATQPKFSVGREYNTITVPVDKLYITEVRWAGRWEYEVFRAGRHWGIRTEASLELEMFPAAQPGDVIVAPGAIAASLLIRIGTSVFNARYVEEFRHMVVAVDPFTNMGRKSARRDDLEALAMRAATAHLNKVTEMGYAPSDEIQMKPYLYREEAMALAA